MSTNRLSGKIALVTGGSSGIGLATAKRFVSEGAYVFITGRRQPELDAAVKHIERDVTGICSDVSNLADLDRVYAAVKTEKGRLDILFANAGGGGLAPLGQITEGWGASGCLCPHLSICPESQLSALHSRTAHCQRPLSQQRAGSRLPPSCGWQSGSPRREGPSKRNRSRQDVGDRSH